MWEISHDGLSLLKPGEVLSPAKSPLQVFAREVRFEKKILVFKLRVPGANAYRVGRLGSLFLMSARRDKGFPLIKKLSRRL